MSVPAALPFERLIVMDDPMPRGAALNMAIDEVLLDRLGEQPLLRIYRWTRSSVSVGCFDLLEPVTQKWPGHDLVRRWTGGGVVEHGNDLTFSVLVPRSFPLAQLPAGESYRVIHAAVAGALAQVGLAVTTHAAGPNPGRSASRACFDNPVPFDLMCSDQKVAGGAQRRTRRGLLHQGSIQEGSHDRSVLADLASALPPAFGQNLDARHLASDALDAAESLVSVKYGAAAWMRRC